MATRGVIGVFLVAAAVAIIVAVIVFSGFSFNDPADNPFGPGEGPPVITMIYAGDEHEGQLLGYTYSSQETISDLPDLNLANITEVPGNTVNVTSGSPIGFDIEGNPSPEARFDSLEVTAYTEQGEPVTVLAAVDDPPKHNYTIDVLNQGEYVLVSTATWLPEESGEAISGYAIYGHRIQVTPGQNGSRS